MVEVWWGSGSGPAWRVLLGFAAKKVPTKGHLLSFSAGDTQTPAFAAISPRGKVPAIRDGAYQLNESLAILAWLDRKHPEPPLFGVTPEEHGQIWRWCLEFDNYAFATAGAVARPIAFGRAVAEADAVRAAIPALHEELNRFASAVSHGGPIVGDVVSAADLCWYTGLSFLMRAASRPAAANFDLGVLPLSEHWPAILAWARHVEAIDGFDAVFPPHWREGELPSPPRWS